MERTYLNSNEEDQVAVDNNERLNLDKELKEMETINQLTGEPE
jgi:hypothetical protein